MPGGKTPGPSIKNPKQYEALRAQGKSKEVAAKISNASAVMRRLQVPEDTRSKRAMFSRGKNVYPGGTHTPHKKRKSLQSVSQRTLYRRLRGK